jgi:hypothetical protein
MLPIKFQFICPRGFRGEYFFLIGQSETRITRETINQLEDDIVKLAYNFCGWYSVVEHTCNDILSIVDIFIKII